MNVAAPFPVFVVGDRVACTNGRRGVIEQVRARSFYRVLFDGNTLSRTIYAPDLKPDTTGEPA